MHYRWEELEVKPPKGMYIQIKLHPIVLTVIQVNGSISQGISTVSSLYSYLCPLANHPGSTRDTRASQRQELNVHTP